MEMAGKKQRVCGFKGWVSLALVIVMPMTLVGAIDTMEVVKEGKWTERRMVFYVHDIPKGPHPTVVQIAKPISPNLTMSNLGFTSAFDDKITEGPDPRSREIGRAQGLYSLASLSEINLLFIFTANFQYPPHLNGSTLSFLGSDRVGLATRDMPVVGGTGAFRFAHGVASVSTISVSLGVNAILKFDLTLRF